MIQEVEDKIQSALTLEFGKNSGFSIEDFPANIEKYQCTSPKGCILVRYNASTFTKPDTINYVSQTELMEFAVFIGLNFLRKWEDAYPYLERIKNCLTGLRINSKQLYPTKRDFIQLLNGSVYWGYIFNIEQPTAEIKEDYNPDNLIILGERI